MLNCAVGTIEYPFGMGLRHGRQHPPFKPLINPRRACAARVTVLGLSFCPVRPSVRLSVCYHVFCHYAQQGGQRAIPTGSVPHWLDFKNGDFRKSTAFKSYGVKTKRTSQYANEHDLPRPDSARFSSTVEAVEVTRRASMWFWFAKNTTYRRSPVQKLWRENQANKPIC